MHHIEWVQSDASVHTYSLIGQYVYIVSMTEIELSELEIAYVKEFVDGRSDRHSDYYGAITFLDAGPFVAEPF